MKHWVTLLSIANSRSEGISDRAAKEIEQLKKQVAQLEKVLEVIPLFKILGVNWVYKILLPNKGKGGRGNGEKEKSSSNKK